MTFINTLGGTTRHMKIKIYVNLSEIGAVKVYSLATCLVGKMSHSQDIEILGWCPAGPVLPHGEVPL